jgi:hypothetical protein
VDAPRRAADGVIKPYELCSQPANAADEFLNVRIRGIGTGLVHGAERRQRPLGVGTPTIDPSESEFASVVFEP